MFKKIRNFLKYRPHVSTIIELLGAIAIWWGIWGILDLFIFPQNEVLSYLASILLGSIILFVSGSGLDDLK